MALVLHGGIEDDAALKRSEVNHLRRLLAWMRCEYMLNDDMQRGFVEAAKWSLEDGIPEERVRAVVAEREAKIQHVPLYVRQAVKMLTEKIREHDRLGDVTDGEVMKNRLEA